MGLYEHILSETIDTLALRELVTVPHDRTVAEVVETLRDKGLGYALVLGPDGTPVGAFTERVLTRALAAGEIEMSDPVRDHVDERYVKVKLSDPIRKVLVAMSEGGTRFVCVTDDEERPVALTGQKGAMECISEYFPTHVRKMIHRVGAENVSKRREGA